MDQSYGEIMEVLGDYFDGFYASDIDKLRSVFHPNCHLLSAADGPLADDDMETIYARVAGRTAPAAVKQKRLDEVISIDKSGPEAALAKVRIAIGPKLYTDYLNLLRIDGRWQIISKIYTHVPVPEAAAQAAE